MASRSRLLNFTEQIHNALAKWFLGADPDRINIRRAAGSHRSIRTRSDPQRRQTANAAYGRRSLFVLARDRPVIMCNQGFELGAHRLLAGLLWGHDPHLDHCRGVEQPAAGLVVTTGLKLSNAPAVRRWRR